MKLTRLYQILILVIILTIGFNTNRAITTKTETIITWVDNQGYWMRLAKQGLVDYNPDIKTAAAIYTGSSIKATLVSTSNSPDVPVTDESSTQSENSITINPLDETVVLNSNNSTNLDVTEKYGADALHSTDSGDNWEGDIEGPGKDNGGDPVTAIGLSGRWFINYIDEHKGMGVSYSDDNGNSWSTVQAAPNPGDLTDKCHMVIDNNHDSPYEGNLYIAWTNVGGSYHGEIGISYSSDNGETWTVNNSISSSVAAGSHNQGVNLSIGPNGELYAFWSIYDTWGASGSDENAIGMAISYDGGLSWTTSQRIATNIRGIRSSLTSKNLRVNSFPVAVVDNSYGADRGAVYVTWTNIGIPGINTGNDIDVYIIKSFDNGDSWSDPVKVNTDPSGLGKEHFMQWITCDNSTGILSMIYYDDRNVDSLQCETFCANSIDGGLTWEDFKISDVSFTPAPIPGLADSYMGDYLGISASNGKVYPVWTDNRTGTAMSYCSPYDTDPVNRPKNLVGMVVDSTGSTTLNWTYDSTPNFSAFVVYRNGDSIATVTDTTYNELLPDYGYYRYRVTAYYNNGRESGASGVKLCWGKVNIDVNTLSIHEHLAYGLTKQDTILIKNTGQLPLKYSIAFLPARKDTGYCEASGGSNHDKEYIKSVEVGDISNLNTGSNNYTDYTSMSTTMDMGKFYNIKVVNGNPFEYDQCGVWVDWNIDQEFTEDELLMLESIADSGYFVGTISPPPGAESGSTRMRIRLAYTGVLSPCNSTYFGEVEDYSILCNGWLDISHMSGTVNPGNTDSVFVEFNANHLPPGDYSTIASIQSNDTSNPSVNVNISLRSDYMVAKANATSNNICFGSIVELLATVTGAYDSVSYVWHSNPEGFNSTSPRPRTIPFEPTWYIIELTSNWNYSTDSVFINLLPIPEFSLGNDTIICDNASLTLTVDNSFTSYLWNNGDTTNTNVITAPETTSTTVSLTVTNNLGCAASDNINIDFVNCSDINEILPDNIIVYPNPAKYQTCISGFNNDKNIDISLFSLKGETLYSVTLYGENTTEINLTNFESGVYIIQIKSENTIITKRLIKE